MRILVCDDHALFREGLRHVLRELAPGVEIVPAAGAAEALRAVEDPALDLVLLDLRLPGEDGLAVLRKIRVLAPTLPVVMLSASESAADARASLEAGASGFVPKSSTAPVLLSALRLVLAGGVYLPALLLDAAPGEPVEAHRRRGEGLTERQREVLVLLARGLTNREIAQTLAIAEGTVKAHVAAIFEALDVTNRTEAASAMHELGLGGPRER